MEKARYKFVIIVIIAIIIIIIIIINFSPQVYNR